MVLRPLDPADDADPEVIRVGPEAERKRRAATRWGMALVLFMRSMAVLWMMFGLTQWANIISPGAAPIDALPTRVAVAVGVFAVADLVAAVGLWLAAPWGGVLWLATAAGEAIAAVTMRGYFSGGWVACGVYVALIAMYFGITWMAAQERERP
ncbi:MAG TPA: DUF6163 family protein [Beijerinckiaceae bacterium]|jgi:hypothetical protein